MRKDVWYGSARQRQGDREKEKGKRRKEETNQGLTASAKRTDEFRRRMRVRGERGDAIIHNLTESSDLKGILHTFFFV